MAERGISCLDEAVCRKCGKGDVQEYCPHCGTKNKRLNHTLRTLLVHCAQWAKAKSKESETWRKKAERREKIDGTKSVFYLNRSKALAENSKKWKAWHDQLEELLERNGVTNEQL